MVTFWTGDQITFRIINQTQKEIYGASGLKSTMRKIARSMIKKHKSGD